MFQTASQILLKKLPIFLHKGGSAPGNRHLWFVCYDPRWMSTSSAEVPDEAQLSKTCLSLFFSVGNRTKIYM